jgi:hypothetical protein
MTEVVVFTPQVFQIDLLVSEHPGPLLPIKMMQPFSSTAVFAYA